MPGGWFPGAGRTAEEVAFLAELRARAAPEGLLDVRPEDTDVVALRDFRQLVVCVRVPGLPGEPARPTLQVGVEFGPSSLVGSWETYGYLLDQYDDIDLTGVGPGPAELAARAFDWLHGQLRRPVERRQWRTWRRRAVSVWVLADDGSPICGDWAAWRRNGRREPLRVEHVRSG